MILRRLLTITILLTSTIWSQAQQINAVPDYVFRNQMSVGRNAVTDTAAYFSIGPRYGATKGFMPPIVGDTATFSSGKRNGLLIFSVQKNKFLYWDSVRVQWSDMAGSSGAYIVAGDTAAMLAPYLRKADTTAMLFPYYRSATASAALALKLNISDTSSMLGNYIRHAGYGLTKSGQSFLVDTLNIATRAWRQKGLDSLAALEVSGSGTTNYVAKFTAGSTIGNSQIFDNGTNVGVSTAAPEAKLTLADGAGYRLAMRQWSGTGMEINAWNDSYQPTIPLRLTANYLTLNTGNPNTERLRIFANGRVFIGASPTDAGYQLDVNGSFRAQASEFVGVFQGTDPAISLKSGTYEYYTQVVATANRFRIVDRTANVERISLTSAGDVGIGQSAPSYKLDINGTLRSVNGANFATTSGNVGIGTASPAAKTDISGTLRIGAASFVAPTSGAGMEFSYRTSDSTGYLTTYSRDYSGYRNQAFYALSQKFAYGTGGAIGLFLTSSGETLINTESDAGDYKLQVSGNIYNTGSAVLAATSGNVGIGTASPSTKLEVSGTGRFTNTQADFEINATSTSQFSRLRFLENGTGKGTIQYLNSAFSVASRQNYLEIINSGGLNIFTANNFSTPDMSLLPSGEVLISTTTDAGDYKLQVVGNARIGTGKLDIASNTTFGIGVARSGTSEVAGQIYNSNGILYLGAESSAGGQIFSGSSAYAAVIGSGAAYPLQFAANNITRATLTTNGNFMIGFPTDTYFYRLQVNGSIFSNNQIIAQNAAAQLNIDSSTNISPLYISNQSLTGSSAQGLFYGSTTWNTTGNPSLIDLAITNTASGSDANYIKISDGSNIFRVTKAAEVVTAAPTGGSIRKWKLGEAATVSPTSPNRTIRVEIDGTVYYLHAKTTND